MRKTPFPQTLFFIRLLLAIFIGSFVLVQFGCNNDVTSAPNPTTDSTQIGAMWVDLKATFKAGCSPDIANGALDSIEKVLRDSATALINGQFPNFKPVVRVEKHLYEPIPYAYIAMGAPLKDTTVSNPTCKCINNCGVCHIISNFPNDSTNNTFQCLATITFKE